MSSSAVAIETSTNAKVTEALALLGARTASSAAADPISSSPLKAVLQFVSEPAKALYSALTATKNALTRPYAQRAFNAVSNVKIGVTVPTIPPLSILIEEEKNSNEVQALRTSHSYQVKTGRGFIRIDMVLAFPTNTLINTELLEILSQFRASPFLTLESEYIAETVYGELEGRTTEYVEERKSSKQKIQASHVELLTARAQVADILQLFGIAIANLDTQTTDQFEKYARDELSKIDITTVSPEGITRALGVEDLLQNMLEKQAQLVDVSKREQAKERTRIRFSYALKTIPVCLRELSLVPLPSEGARLHLSLLVFNHFAFSPKLLFRTSVGGWTPSVDHCPLWVWFFRKKAATIGMSEYRDTERTRIIYPVLDTAQPTASIRLSAKQLENTLVGTDPTSYLRYRALDIETDDFTSKKGIVLTNIICSISNRIAIHPILSSQYPTVQYLGGIPGQVVLELMVPHSELASLNNMKRSVDAVSLHPGGRRLRRGTIKIEGNGTVLCLLGMREFQIDSLTTETVGPSHSQVVIRLTAFRQLAADKLEFDAERSGENDSSRLKIKFAKLFDMSAQYKVKKRASRVGLVPDADDSLEGQAHKALWGTSSEDNNAVLGIQPVVFVYKNSEKFKQEIDSFSGAGSRSLALHAPWGPGSPPPRLGISLNSGDDTAPTPATPQGVRNANAREASEIAYYRWVSVDGPSPSLVLSQALIDEVFDKEELAASVTKMAVLDLGGAKYPEPLVKYLDEVTQVVPVSTELYPDLYLPTYGEALNSILSEYLKVFSTTYSLPTADQIQLASLPRPAERLMLSLVGAPTHRELGHADVPETELDHPAVDQNDYVDPDFYFFRFSATDLFTRPKDQVLDLIEKFGRATEDRSSTLPAWEELTKASQQTGPQLAQTKLSRGLAEEKYTQIPRETLRTFDPDTNKIGTEPSEILSNYATPMEAALQTFHDDKSTSRVKSLFVQRVRSFKDDLYRMVRAFPTFKLYLIEEDEERLLLLDDWYGFNAVREAHVTRHKWEPDVAELELINILGTLDDEGFQKIGGEEDPIHQQPVKMERVTTEQHPRLLRKFPIQEGTRIVLKFGYSSQESELETVFTGKVVEINKGDVISVVAQGYGMELTAPISEDTFNLSTWFEKAIKMLLGIPYRHGILTLVSNILSSQPAEHFGGWGLRNILPLSMGGLAPSQLARSESFEDAGDFFKVLLADPRLMNVFSSVPLRSRIIRGRDDSTLNDEDRQDSWKVGGKTGLQLLRELNFHHPDMIFAVVPFDHKATLFFGRPDDEITYTDKYRRAQMKDIISQKRRIDPLAKLPGLVNGSTENPFKKIALAFIASPEAALTREFDLKEAAQSNWNPLDNLSAADALIHSLQVASNLREAPDIYPALLGTLRSKVVIEEILYQLLQYNNIPEEGGGRFGAQSRALDHLRRGDVRGELGGFRGLSLSSSGVDLVLTDRQFQVFWDEVEERVDNFSVELLAELQEAGKSPLGAALALPPTITGGGPQLLLGLDLAYKKLRETFGTPAAISNRVRLRRLMLAFRDYIRRVGISGLPAEVKEICVASFGSPDIQRLGKKPFRSYHFVDSVHHILQNSIVATRAEMENISYVRGRENDNFVASVDDDLLVGEYIPGFHSSPNAEFPRQGLMSAYGHLAEGMRPMYRGELIIRGNERIKPHDVVWILDLYNGMWGPIEVERVTHHFSYEQGFITTIIPHLHCSVANNVTWMETTGWNLVLGVESLSLAASKAGIGGLLGGWPGVFVGGMVGLGLGSDQAQLESGGEGIFGCLSGRGSFGRKENPVTFYPLMLHGLPFLAGLRGYNPGNAYFFSQTGKRFKLWSRGATRFRRLAAAVAGVS